MLYTKYRPQNFNEMVGLEALKNTLAKQVKEGTIGHAYLFSGPRGTGKTTTARILAKAINCKDAKNGEPCGQCSNCRQIQEGRFVDLIEIDAASNRGIDDIRSLREKVRLAPAHGKYKVYIIDEVHMLTTEAFNALLKTLEEPPAHAVFILATTEPHKLPDTIHSRCQRFSFERAPVSLIIQKLKEIVKKEDLKVTDEQLSQIAKAAGGGFRDAETLLEQVATGGEDVEKLVGFAKLADMGEFVGDLIAGSSSKALVFINNLYNNGVDMSSLNIAVLEYLRDLLLIQAGVGNDLIDTGKEQFEEMQKTAQAIPPQKLKYMINKFTQSYEFLPQSAIPTLPLEVAVVEVTRDGLEMPAEPLDLDPQPPKIETAASKKEPQESKPQNENSVAKIAHTSVSEDDKLVRLIAAAKPLNHSVAGLLRSCRLGEVTSKAVTIQAFYDFHKEKLEDLKSQSILSEAVKQVFGKPLKVKIELTRK